MTVVEWQASFGVGAGEKLYPVYVWGRGVRGKVRSMIVMQPRSVFLKACNICLEYAGRLDGSRTLREFARQPENYYWRLRWLRSGCIHPNAFCR